MFNIFKRKSKYPKLREELIDILSDDSIDEIILYFKNDSKIKIRLKSVYEFSKNINVRERIIVDVGVNKYHNSVHYNEPDIKEKFYAVLKKIEKFKY
jgi:hypothetical protein